MISAKKVGAIVDLLKAEAVGQANAMKVNVIAARCEIDDNPQHSKTREMIRAAIEINMVPVCSSSAGFWIPTKKDDVRRCVISLRSRAVAIQARADALLLAAAGVRLDGNAGPAIQETLDLDIGGGGGTP